MDEVVVRTDESAKKLENFLKKEFPVGMSESYFGKTAYESMVDEPRAKI